MIPARHAPWHFPGASSTWHIFSPATLTLRGYNWIIFGGLKLFLATWNHYAISLLELVLLFFCCSFQRLLANRFCPTSLSIPSCFLHKYVWRNNISVQRHIWEITTKFNKRSSQLLWDKEKFPCSEQNFLLCRAHKFSGTIQVALHWINAIHMECIRFSKLSPLLPPLIVSV